MKNFFVMHCAIEYKLTSPFTGQLVKQTNKQTNRRRKNDVKGRAFLLIPHFESGVPAASAHCHAVRRHAFRDQKNERRKEKKKKKRRKKRDIRNDLNPLRPSRTEAADPVLVRSEDADALAGQRIPDVAVEVLARGENGM